VSDTGYPHSGFGDRLRREREAAGLTQEELAERTGLSVRAISNIERGQTTTPRPSSLRLIARELTPAARHPGPAGWPASGMGAPPQWPAGQLPAALADFTGRDEQTRQLTSLLAADSDGQAQGAVVLAVTGGAGTGKSAFAIHVAHRSSAQFPDGQLFLDLRGRSSRPVASVDALARFLRDLSGGLAAASGTEDELAARYRSLLAGLRLLIVLDDARDAAQVRPLLPGAGRCAVVVTSRHCMADLESARVTEMDTLADAEAAAMFARIVGSRVEAEPRAVREVLAACGGLPLAIRIAAARLVARPRWPVEALASRLADERGRLNELQAGDLAVRASFGAGYATVRAATGQADVAPDRAFRLLGLAGGSDISLPAAAALLGISLARAEQALELLVDHHLLQSAEPGRYRFHDLLRVYAGERVLTEDRQAERDQAVGRMLRWYLGSAAAAARVVHPNGSRLSVSAADDGHLPLTFAGYADALAWLDTEYANLVGAVRQAAGQGEHELAWKLPACLCSLFYLRGHVDDWIDTHQIGLTSARALGDRQAELWLRNNLGIGYLHARRPDAAVGYFRQNLAIVREAGDQLALPRTMVNLGDALTKDGHGNQAIRPLHNALRLFREIGNRAGEGTALGSIGKVCQLRGEFSDAIGHYRLAIAASEETSNFVAQGNILLELSTTHLALGQVEEAVQQAMNASELFGQTGNLYGRAQAMTALGRAERHQGNAERARSHWLDAFGILTELEHPQAREVIAELGTLKA
jgi:transcriptional regulator with XRE-family HTH domain/tetratricopeptide (TPR) repeat protein